MARQARGSGRVYRDGSKWRAALDIGRNPVTGKKMIKSVRVTTYQEAVSALRKMTVLHGTGNLTSTDSQSLSSFLDHWLETTIKPERQPETYRLYEWICRSHLKPILGKRPVNSITRNDVRSLISAKATQVVAPKGPKSTVKNTKTLSTNTLRNIRSVLHAALEEARRDRMITVNPAELVKIPNKERKEVPTWLTPEQATKLIATIDGQELGSFFTFILHTGTRIGEAAGVRWKDVKLGDQPTVTIAGQLQRVKGRGLIWKPGTKTNQIRCLALTDTLTKLVEAIYSDRLISDQVRADGLVFVNAYGNPIDTKYAGDKLKGYCKLAEVPIISPHKLRHTAASLMLAATGDLHAVQKVLGHSQVALTANLYGHASAETLRPAFYKLESIYYDAN